ncbi:hypothetical protein FDV58_16275 [Bradyrhizobium elkanii]|uniref:Uncharacterized protein n=1 Tax=Bradyrhizobium elkanii TaxID=29448 RepID=A0A4U6S6L3_BRAEL|nr:hypothetical protein [Bradyrhizobium sp. BR2003]TKV80336.1 hypothetical protein FDV58_16275 [Bradyrhizobium elkanii]
MDNEFCKERARTVRALAEQADPFIKKRLLQLADHYERRVTIQPDGADSDPKRGTGQQTAFAGCAEKPAQGPREQLGRLS